MEAAEVRQVRHVGHERLDAGLEGGAFRLAAGCEPALDPARDLDQHADELGDVAAGVVDVRLQEHAVARGLVELDVVLAREQALELGAVEPGGPADEGHARRVEIELVLAHGMDHVGPGGPGREVVLEPRLPVLGRDHRRRRRARGNSARSADGC